MGLKRLLAAVVLAAMHVTGAMADPMTLDDFGNGAAGRWRFFADTVMGGVSTGKVEFVNEKGVTFARMSGAVSTANNGGFIQFRTDLAGRAPEGAQGVRLVARGNGERYFVHLRTAAMLLPWQYYQAGFSTGPGWREVRLPFSSFKPSGRGLAASPDPISLRSIAIVAYGRDHEARVEVRQVGFF
ncbi:MAG TPA: CIA30 family protein [Rhizobiaceae bacterium]|nr:CIA30 family protein [Rhizobiaceae bacterium]